MRFEISLFKFDSQSDYLPYYKKYFIKVTTEKTLLDLFETMYEQASFAYEKSSTFGVVVNNLYTDLSLSIEDIKQDFGYALTIEPLSIKRAHSDLLIDTKDFYEKLEQFGFAIDTQNKIIYEEQKNLYYASNTLNFNKDYLGDPLFLLAHRLLKKYEQDNEKKKQILDVIGCAQTGLIFHTSLLHRVYKYDIQYDQDIDTLKKRLHLNRNFNQSKFVFKDRLNDDIIAKHSLEGFTVSYYSGVAVSEETQKLLHKSKATIINLSSMKYDLALDVFHLNARFVFELAADILLDAYDQGVDYLIVDDTNLLYLFDSHRKDIQKIAGRDIPIPVLHTNELQLLIEGSHKEAKKLITKHCIGIDLI